jgi:hypothetical protein
LEMLRRKFHMPMFSPESRKLLEGLTKDLNIIMRRLNKTKNNKERQLETNSQNHRFNEKNVLIRKS